MRLHSAIAFHFLIALSLLRPAAAEEVSIIRITDPNVHVRIAVETERTFAVPAMNLESDHTAVLCWRARIDADKQGGGREFMRIRINGKPVGAMQDRLARRLLNKAPRFKDYRNKEHAWYVAGAEGWLIPFSPDFSAPGIKTWFHRMGSDAFHYEVDVTDLLRDGGDNSLTIQNLMKKRYMAKYRERGFEKSSGDLVVGDARIEVRKGARKKSEPADLRPAQGPWNFRVTDTGDVVVNWGEREVKIQGMYAWGDATWKALNLKEMPTVQSQGSPSQWKLTAETLHYRIERSVRLDAENGEQCIRIADRFVRKGNEDPVVIAPRYHIMVPGNRFGTAWIGGNSDPGLQSVNSPYNPTLFIPMDGVGLGVAVDDDVLRLQGKFSYDAEEGKGSILTDELVVSRKGGDEYTVALSIYPVNHASYWDFINSVRKDRKITEKMPGTIWFTYPEKVLATEAIDLSRFVQKNRLAYVIFWENPSPQYHPVESPYVIKGPAQLKEEARAIRGPYEENLKKAIDYIHGISDRVKVLLYFHSHTVSLFEQDRLGELRDSLITGRAGRPLRRHPNIPRYYPLYYVYPTEENHHGRELDRLVDHLLDLGADGLYWDGMPAADGEVKYTYSEFDGYTADIDLTTQEVRTRKGLVALLSSKYKCGLVNRLLGMHKVVHANGPPETKEMGLLPITRMMETKTSGANVRDLHLSTPYAYTWEPFDMEQYRERLKSGGVCFRPEDSSLFIPLSFPLTPTYVGSGYVLGKERILTAVAGRFGWPGSWKGTLTLFDGSGRVKEQRAIQGDGESPINVMEGGLTIVEKAIPPTTSMTSDMPDSYHAQK